MDAQARLKGLPTYREFHEQQGVEYTPPDSKFFSPANKTAPQNPPVQQSPIYPSSAQKPMSYALQIEEQARYANNLAAKLQSIRWDTREQKQAPPAEAAKPNPAGTFQYKGENLWDKLQSGEAVSELEMKQLFHIASIELALAKTEAEKRKAESLRQAIEEKLIENAVANAERDEDGNVILQGVSVRSEDALYFAKQDIQHFQKTDTHLKPSQIVALKDTHHADTNANTAYEFINYSNRDNIPRSNVNDKNIQHKLVFDGENLIDYQYKNHKFVQRVMYPATSGVQGSTDPQQPFRGPIPEGRYFLYTREISTRPWRSFTNLISGDWGMYRVPLVPAPETNTFGRSEFYIHGGRKPGSAGCIDLGSNDTILLGNLMEIPTFIIVEVKYKKKKGNEK